jgi:hypothetical protein
MTQTRLTAVPPRCGDSRGNSSISDEYLHIAGEVVE